MEDSQFKRTIRTVSDLPLCAVGLSHLHFSQGTPVFIARAVQQGEPVTLHRHVTVIPAVPVCPDDYARNHPERIKKFPFEEEKLIRSPMNNVNRQWRHELDHDAESVFWLLLYWVLGAQPAQGPTTNIGVGAWGLFMGDVSDRIGLLTLLSDGAPLSGLMHPVYQPLFPLLSDLASIVTVDRYWLNDTETRNHPGYVPEAFQRLILKFILDNRDKEFMTKEVKLHFRQVERITNNLSLSITTSHQRHTESSRKRPSPEPRKQRMKRRRVVKEVIKVCHRSQSLGCHLFLYNSRMPMSQIETQMSTWTTKNRVTWMKDKVRMRTTEKKAKSTKT